MMKKLILFLCAAALLVACGSKNDGNQSDISVPAKDSTQKSTTTVPADQKYYALGAYVGSFLKQQAFPLDIDKFAEGVRAGFDGTCNDSREEIGNMLKKIKPSVDSSKCSYFMGADNGVAFREFELEADVDQFVKGVQDMMNGACKLSPEALKQVSEEFNAEVQENMKKKAVAESKDFLEQNKKKAGVKVTASGLQYKVLKQGKGKKPTANDFVKVHYTGKLVNGQVFDSSVKRGEPATFQLNQVIKGWTEGLQLMNVGSKYELYIPSELGYGDQGMSTVIPGGATLIFEVELLEINPSNK